MLNVYKNQQNRQTGSRNLMSPKTLPTIWGTYTKLVTKIFGHMLHIGMPYYGKRFWTRQIRTSCMPTLLIFIHIEHICAFFVAFFSATIDRFLPSIVAEKNVTKNAHICSMCIKINSRHTGSTNLTGPKTLPTIWHIYMKLVTNY
jgi:hypothetical protein